MSENANENIFQFRKNFVNPDSVKAIHANEATINYTPTEFFVTFYRLEPPIVLDEKDKQKVKEEGSLDAIAVSKIVITPSFARAFHRVLSDQLKSYDKNSEAVQSASTNEETNE